MHAPKPDLHSVRATPNNTRHTKKNERHREDGFAALSAGRRGLDIAGLPASRKHSLSEVEPSQPIFRSELQSGHHSS